MFHLLTYMAPQFLKKLNLLFVKINTKMVAKKYYYYSFFCFANNDIIVLLLSLIIIIIIIIIISLTNLIHMCKLSIHSISMQTCCLCSF